MSYDPNNHDDLSELLSGYLDGELTADEQALVEQRLAESAEFRQLHDDLRALRSSLEMLPRYKLTEDLAPIVLRRAERAMLSAPAAAQLAAPPRENQVTLAESATPQVRIGRSWRAVRWSAVAIAVALLIMVFNPARDRDGQNVAVKQEVRDERAPSATSATSTEEPRGHRRLDAVDRELGETLGDRARTPSMQAPAAPPTALAESVEEMNVTESLSRDQKVTSFSDAPKAAAAKDADAGIVGGKGSAADESKSEGGEKMKALTNELQDAAPPPAAIVGEAVQQFQFRRQTAQSRFNKAPADKYQVVAPTGGVLVVECEISEEALRSRAFEQLLTEQQIALVEHTNGVAAPALAVTAETDVAPAQKPADAIAENAPAGPADEAGRELERKSENAQAIADGEVLKREVEGVAPPIDAYYVEASPAQIEATLAALGAQPEQFPSLRVDNPAANQLREEEAAKLGRDDRLSKKSAESLDKVELPKPSEPIVKESKRASGVVADQEGNTSTFNLNLQPAGSEPAGSQPAGGGGGAGGFVGQVQRGVTLRGSVGIAKSRASAQRVLVTPEQFGATSQPGVSVERFKEDANRENAGDDDLQLKQKDRAEKKFAERRKAPARVRAFSQTAPAEAPPVDSPAAPAQLAAPAAEPAPVADGIADDKSGKVAGRPSAGADAQQAPSVRVLFLFRAVPAVPAAASER